MYIHNKFHGTWYGHYMGQYNVWYREQWRQKISRQSYTNLFRSVLKREHGRKKTEFLVIKQAHLERSVRKYSYILHYEGRA